MEQASNSRIVEHHQLKDLLKNHSAKIKTILKKHPTKREKKDVDFLDEIMQHIDTFAKVKKNHSGKYKLLLKSLSFRKVSKGQFLFKYGDDGNQFYVILKGSIEILKPYERNIPKEAESENSNAVVSPKNP